MSVNAMGAGEKTIERTYFECNLLVLCLNTVFFQKSVSREAAKSGTKCGKSCRYIYSCTMMLKAKAFKNV